MTVETHGKMSASLDEKEKTIQKLIEEKKALEEKNKRLASILEITAKNASKLKEQEAAKAESSEDSGSEVASQVSSIKKELGSLERKIEKSKSAQSSEQLNTVLVELKARFDKVDERLNALDKIAAVEKKLGDVQDSVTLRKKSNANLFGGLGTLGGGTDSDSEEGQSDADGAEANSGDSDEFSKLDEINLKIDSISKRLDDLHIGEKHSLSDSLKKIIPSFAEKPSVQNNDGYASVQQSKQDRQDVNEASAASKFGDISRITFKKVENAPSPEEHQDYISLESQEAGKFCEERNVELKVHTPEHFLDFKKIPDDIRQGHVVLLNVKSLKEESMDELRHFVEKIKKVSDSISSRIMGIGEHHIIILPKKINYQDSERHE